MPCAAHSLNLVGSNSAEKVLPAKLLLGTIQNLYNFFASSPSKWKVLMDKCKITLKQYSHTRWCSKARAVSALWNQFGIILETLESFQPDFYQKNEDLNITTNMFSAEVCADAASRLQSISNFKFLLGLCIWNKILFQINQCNEYLQSTQCDVSRAGKKLLALNTWLEEFQENGWNDSLEQCKIIAEEMCIDLDSGFANKRRGRGVNPKYDEASTVASAKQRTNLERFKCEFFDALLTSLTKDMKQRFHQLRKATLDFSFLWGDGLANMSAKE